MSKIVYLFGAGASFGKRAKNDENEILEGLPIVSEFPMQIDKLIAKIESGNTESSSQLKAKSDEVDKLITELTWLKEASKNHQTVDTYAKKLRVTKGVTGTDYLRVKAAISAFLTLEQLFNKPDSRYDAFFANILGKQSFSLPEDVAILSWNYDCQFELAHAAYSERKDLTDIWNDLRIRSKTTKDVILDKTGFSITKLNGTALMYEGTNYNSKFFDAFFNRQGMSEISYVYTAYFESLNSVNMNNALSFAWESTDGTFLEGVKSRIVDAEVLVIIGYSFPFFNRELDRSIIQNMKKLKKVYIQDPNCDEVKEHFEAVLSEEQVIADNLKYKLNKGVSQFLIPNEM